MAFATHPHSNSRNHSTHLIELGVVVQFLFLKDLLCCRGVTIPSSGFFVSGDRGILITGVLGKTIFPKLPSMVKSYLPINGRGTKKLKFQKKMLAQRHCNYETSHLRDVHVQESITLPTLSRQYKIPP
eukprot:scaffold164862_cov35-Attheya_sp.AAC.4